MVHELAPDELRADPDRVEDVGEREVRPGTGCADLPGGLVALRIGQAQRGDEADMCGTGVEKLLVGDERRLAIAGYASPDGFGQSTRKILGGVEQA